MEKQRFYIFAGSRIRNTKKCFFGAQILDAFTMDDIEYHWAEGNGLIVDKESLISTPNFKIIGHNISEKVQTFPRGKYRQRRPTLRNLKHCCSVVL